MTSALRAELSVASLTYNLAQLEEILGLASGPAGYSKGDPGKFANGGVRPRSTWVYPLSWNVSLHGGTAGLDAAISGLPAMLADRLSSAHELGCEVVLSVVQLLSTSEPERGGLHLSSATVSWLARARAVVDVDQYVGD